MKDTRPLDLPELQRRLGSAAAELEDASEKLLYLRSLMPWHGEESCPAPDEDRRPPSVEWVIRGAMDCVIEGELNKVITTLHDAAKLTQAELDEQWRNRSGVLPGGGPRP